MKRSFLAGMVGVAVGLALGLGLGFGAGANFASRTIVIPQKLSERERLFLACATTKAPPTAQAWRDDAREQALVEAPREAPPTPEELDAILAQRQGQPQLGLRPNRI